MLAKLPPLFLKKPEPKRLEQARVKKELSKSGRLTDGDPLKNLKLIADPAKNFVVIMKDGKIYKNLIR